MSTKQQNKKPYKRTSKAVAAKTFLYPKRYEIKIEPDKNGVVKIIRTNENFNAYELYGHLSFILLDIEKQLVHPSQESELLEPSIEEEE